MVTKSAQYGIIRIGIFGSVARGEQSEDSDVDICCWHIPNATSIGTCPIIGH